ncbi:MAG: hypothetical protein GEV08_22105 [Acidimicrobiia bacterium]|nr:hypothetical protein [Acidimicrobiia bacterium]
MTTPAPSLGDAQRARLARAKLRALARERFGGRDWAEEDLSGLPALHDGDEGVVLLEARAWGLGLALVWADKVGLAGGLHVVVEVDAGVAARRAALLAPTVRAWSVRGTTLEEARPAPHAEVLAPPEDALVVAEPLRRRGADLVVEHGVVLAEILGLEVGRVVPDEAAPSGWALEVGVGKNDRAASVVMGALRSAEDAVRNVVEVVGAHRRPGAAPHLLNRLARPRWLRASVLGDPGLVGATSLAPLEPPLPRQNLIDPVPALAAGQGPDGAPIVVACSVGVDLEAVPIAADARDRYAPDADLVLVTPARDQYPPLRRAAALLRRPARLVAVEGPWPL